MNFFPKIVIVCLTMGFSTIVFCANETSNQDFFRGKTVLITGGTGFLGRALTKEILLYHPRQIIIFSRDEVKHYVFAKEINDPCIKHVIGDVRDFTSINEAMQGVDYVIHAAALKRIDDLEYNTEENVKTNVLGSLNVVRACCENNVKKAVLISTDKACFPINVYGAAKFISERNFIAGNIKSQTTRFFVVRYGNVLNSTGSVIPLFVELIKNNKKITLTDPEMTRFIIYEKQAVDLVFDALQCGVGGEIFIPCISSMRIIDLIDVLKNYYGVHNEVVITGIRPGEKMHEIMLNESELLRTYQKMGRYVIVPMIRNPNIDYGCYTEVAQLQQEYSSKDHTISTSQLKKVLQDCDFLK